jgi:hypothetical protein
MASRTIQCMAIQVKDDGSSITVFYCHRRQKHTTLNGWYVCFQNQLRNQQSDRFTDA